jgi:hypothetical protein
MWEVENVLGSYCCEEIPWPRHYYNGQYLIETGLQFQRFRTSSSWQEAWQHLGRLRLEELRFLHLDPKPSRKRLAYRQVGGVSQSLLPQWCCSDNSWLSTWLYLEWTTIQNWKALLWALSGCWEILVSDLNLGMEIIRHSGYKFQKIKTERSLSSRSSGIKGVEVNTFTLSHTFC